MLFQTCAFLAVLSLVSTAPLQVEPETDIEARQLTYSTPGINFNYVTQECNPTQQAILRSVAISTQDFLGYADYGYERHKSGRQVELKQISYRCQEEHLKKCTNDLTKGVGAYTSSPQRTGKGWQITFCPAFFAKQAAKDIAAKGRTTSINKLISLEHLMAHEYMHVAMLGHCENIIDVNTTLLPSTNGAYGQGYGASRCKEWAWLNVPNGDNPQSYYTKSSINREVVLNADNYAWYATSEYFSYIWQKNSAKKERRQIQGESALFDDSTQPGYANFAIDPESGDSVNQGIAFEDDNDAGDADVVVKAGEDPNLSWPQNCHAPNNTDPDGQLLCGYVGEQYSDYTASVSAVGPAPTDLPNLNATNTTSAPAVTSSQPAATSSAAPLPYQAGTCSFHIEEYATCEDESKNLYANVTMWDNGGSGTPPIGQTDLSKADNPSFGNHIDSGNSYSFTSKLFHPLIITGEHENDYVQLTIADQSFKSTDGNCHQGGWDPRDRECGVINKNGIQNVVQNQGIDCSFPCPAGT